jgi:hypothetical protein
MRPDRPAMAYFSEREMMMMICGSILLPYTAKL